MIDRWGNSVRVGWAAHEILWLEAAMSLPVLDRPAAYKDISELTGRSLHSAWLLSKPTGRLPEPLA